MGQDDQTPPNKAASLTERLEQAYETMLERVRHTLDELDDKLTPRLTHALKAARERAEELGELSREESELIADYVQRDVEDAGEYLARTGGDIRDWLKFDLELVEDRLLEWLMKAADQTDLELLSLQEQAERTRYYHTGEITGPGTLACSACGQTLRFQKAGHIPPCPKCHGQEFLRARK